MKEVVITSACRTAVGSFRGALAGLGALDLGKTVILEAMARAGIKGEDVDEVIMGCVLPHGMGQNPARQAVLRAGLPFDVGCITVNKVCGSGLKAVMLAAQAVACGDAEVVVAGGMEIHVQRALYLLPQGRAQAMRMGDGKAIDSMVLRRPVGPYQRLSHGHERRALRREVWGQPRRTRINFRLRVLREEPQGGRRGPLQRDQIVPVEIPQKKGATQGGLRPGRGASWPPDLDKLGSSCARCSRRTAA